MSDYTTELLQISSYVIGIMTGALLLTIVLLFYYHRKLNRLRMADDDFDPSESDSSFWKEATPDEVADTLVVTSPKDEDADASTSAEPETETATVEVRTPEAETEAMTPSPQSDVKRPTKAEIAEERLYKEVTTAIVKEKLYLKPGFGRTDIVERFGISAHRAGMIFSKRQTSIPEFVRNCRLEHAERMMIDQPQASLADIATASGFIHLSTFIRDFKDRYGVTPARFRETLPGND